MRNNQDFRHNNRSTRAVTPNTRRTRTSATNRQRTRRRWIAGFVGVVAVAAIVAGAWAFTQSPNGGNPLSNFMKTFSPLGPTNILLIGNNARDPKGPLDVGTAGGQADIMMLAHIVPSQHRVVLISIPRDMLYAMPQYDVSIPKIKSLFFVGAQMAPNQAAQLTVDGVQKFTGMHIDYWVVANFQGFADAINAVGGVRVYVPGRIYDPWYSGANFFPGWQVMNGNMALEYVRVRQNTFSSAGSNDFKRDDAQAQVLTALQQKLLNRQGDMAHIGSLVNTWYKDVATNMSVDDLIKVAEAVHGAKISHINLASVGDSMDVMSASVQGINKQNQLTGAYYDVIDPQAVTKALQPYGSRGAWTGITLPSPSNIPVEIDTSSAYVSALRQAGYPVTVTGAGGGQSQVVIAYPPGKLAWGLEVGRTLATGNSMIQQGSLGSVVVYGP